MGRSLVQRSPTEFGVCENEQSQHLLWLGRRGKDYEQKLKATALERKSYNKCFIILKLISACTLYVSRYESFFIFLRQDAFSEHLLITDRSRIECHLNTSRDMTSLFLFFWNSFRNKMREISDSTDFLEQEQSHPNIFNQHSLILSWKLSYIPHRYVQIFLAGNKWPTLFRIHLFTTVKTMPDTENKLFINTS
jgi:hypothetical protein